MSTRFFYIVLSVCVGIPRNGLAVNGLHENDYYYMQNEVQLNWLNWIDISNETFELPMLSGYIFLVTFLYILNCYDHLMPSLCRSSMK